MHQPRSRAPIVARGEKVPRLPLLGAIRAAAVITILVFASGCASDSGNGQASGVGRSASATAVPSDGAPTASPTATPTVTPTPKPTAPPTLRATPKPTAKPTPKPPLPATQAPAPKAACDPSYVGVCLQDGIGDYDCAGGSGNGPNYVRGPFKVVGSDPFGLDADHDGIGCENG